jgi:hypothetical protein
MVVVVTELAVRVEAAQLAFGVRRQFALTGGAVVTKRLTDALAADLLDADVVSLTVSVRVTAVATGERVLVAELTEQAFFVRTATADAGAVGAADLTVTALLVRFTRRLLDARAVFTDTVDAVFEMTLVARAVQLIRAATVGHTFGDLEVLIAYFVCAAVVWPAALSRVDTIVGVGVADLAGGALVVRAASLLTSTGLTNRAFSTLAVVLAPGEQAFAGAAVLVFVGAMQVDLAVTALAGHANTVVALRVSAAFGGGLALASGTGVAFTGGFATGQSAHAQCEASEQI